MCLTYDVVVSKLEVIPYVESKWWECICRVFVGQCGWVAIFILPWLSDVGA